MNGMTRNERGLIMLEALLAMALIVTTASCAIWFLHRAQKGAAFQRSQINPPCEKPTCARALTMSECRCGDYLFYTR